MGLLQMSISGAVMIIAIVVIRTFSINRLPKKTFIFLWGIVLLRLLVPFCIPSPFSAYSLITNHVPIPQGKAGIENAAVFPIQPAEPDLIHPAVPAKTEEGISLSLLVWGIGFIVCILFFAVSYIKCRRKFRESLPVKNKDWINWIAGFKSIRPVELRQLGCITAPLTYGIIKPVILMPKKTDWSNTEQIEYMLTHELVHVRRFDAATKLILTAALCVHWFNPFVWVMYLLSNQDIELSCDETVVRSFGSTTKSAYAHTLISMEEKKNSLTPLCNSFSKNAIEERITAIMKMKKTSFAAILTAALLILMITTAFATSAATSDKPLAAIPNTKFTQDEYKQLSAYHFDGFRKMSVAKYQNKVWTMRDTPESMALLERFNQDTQLFDMRYENDTASFLFNTLIPLTAEKWQTREFSHYTQAPDGDLQGDHAILEYQVSLTISNANRLTVEEYEQTRQGVMDGLQKFLHKKSNAELQDKIKMDAAILAEIEKLKDKWETSALQIAVGYNFMPLSLYESPSDSVSEYEKEEVPMYPPATKADYQSVLKLKTTDYQSQSISVFNAALLEWGNEDFERSERINGAIGWNDFQVPLTEEERTFISWTIHASGQENAKLVQSHYTGKEKEDPFLGNFNLEKRAKDHKKAEWTTLFYQLTYHISDENKLTVGERDRVLMGVVNDIQKYWDAADMDTISAMDSNSMLKKLNTIAAKQSNDLISIAFTDGDVHLEFMSEPIRRE